MLSQVEHFNNVAKKFDNSIFIRLFVCVILILPSFTWILIDRSIWPWDQSWYGEVTTELYWQLRHDVKQWWPAMLAAFGAKAPGLAWFAQLFVPLRSIVGSVEGSLLLVQLLFLFLTVYLVGSTAEKIAGKEEKGIKNFTLAATATASAPMLIGMTHQFFVEAFQCCCVAYCLYISVNAWYKDVPWTIVHSILAASLAMLSKVSSPMYVIIPGCIIVIALAGAIKNRRFATQISTYAMAIPTLLITYGTISWYVKNISTTIDFIHLAASSEVAMYYGQIRPFWSKILFWFYSFINSVTISYIFWLNIVVFTIFCLKKKFNKKRRFIVIAGLCIFQLAIVIIILSIQINEETRYLTPLIPIFSILVYCFSRLIPESKAIFLVIFLLQYCLSYLIAFGAFSGHTFVTHWVKEINSIEQGRKSIERVIELTSPKKLAGKYVINGLELSNFNANTLSFFAAKRKLKYGYRSYYTTLGYAAKDVDAAWERLNKLDISFYTVLEPQIYSQHPDFLNIVSLPIFQRIASSPFFEKVYFLSEMGVSIYKPKK
jgi:hypothetical protein